ncbi:MAG: hypothetical protein P1U56_13025 [Saprospiraceae bacterium]|nr:hypothetical protein [Saprospiraceae bacterium]
MRLLIIINIIVLIVLTWAINSLVITESVLTESLGEQLSSYQIKDIIDGAHKFIWIDYLLSVFGYIIKILCVSSLFYAMLHLSDIKVKFKPILNSVVFAYTIFLIPLIIRVIVFATTSDTYSLDEIHNYSFGSLMSLFDINDFEPWARVGFRSINIWEVLFVIYISFQFKEYYDGSVKVAAENVVIVYLTALLLWTSFLVFLSVTLS